MERVLSLFGRVFRARSSGHGQSLSLLILCSTPLGLAGCKGALSALDPAGPAAAQIATLWSVMLSGSALIFAGVMLLVFLACRGRAKAADRRVWFWGLGLAFPLVTLTALTTYGLILGARMTPGAETAQRTLVQAEARQWHWTFRYGDAPGRVTENILHIPAGRPVEIEITSRDVIHSFWVPRLAGKLDAIPGRVNRLHLQADQPGDYAGASAEFSGAGYGAHVFSLRAHAPADWHAFLAGETP